MTRQTIRKSGRPLTGAEKTRRWRTRKKTKLKADLEAERAARRVEATRDLVIHRISIQDLNFMSEHLDVVPTNPVRAALMLWHANVWYEDAPRRRGEFDSPVLALWRAGSLDPEIAEATIRRFSSSGWTISNQPAHTPPTERVQAFLAPFAARQP
jgi:hypothetical protein